MMTLLLAIPVYFFGWLVAAAIAMRALADRMECGRGYCGHGASLISSAHWKGDGSIGQREVIVGSWAALAWPVLWLPAAAYLIANRRPTPRAMQTRITELEREMGIR